MRAARRCYVVSLPRPALATAVMIVATCAAAPALCNDLIRTQFPPPASWELTIGPTLRGRSPDLAPRSFDRPAASRNATILPDIEIIPVLPGTSVPSPARAADGGRTWRAPGEAIEEPRHEMFGAKLKLPF